MTKTKIDKAMPKVSAAEIKIALAKMHRDDYFLDEVKSGSVSMGTASRILDALAIKKSYANKCFVGYEWQCRAFFVRAVQHEAEKSPDLVAAELPREQRGRHNSRLSDTLGKNARVQPVIRAMGHEQI